MKISSFVLLFASISVLLVSFINYFEFGRLFFGDKGAFLIVSIFASILAATLSYKVGYTLTQGDFKGNMSSLALFLWLMLAFDFIFNLGGLFNDTENTRGAFIALVILSPILLLYYKKIKRVMCVKEA